MKSYLKLKQLHMGNVPGSDISLEVQRGEVVAITGRNGSGKTSLAKYLTGVVKPEKIGQILIDNLDPYSELDRDKLAKLSFYVCQNPREGYVFEDVAEDLRFRLQNLGMPAGKIKKRIQAYLRRFHLKLKKHQLYQDLTGAETARLQIIKALMSHADLLVLDEAFSMLTDAGEVFDILRAEARKRKQTVIIFTKEESILAAADRTFLLENGLLTENDDFSEVAEEVFHDKWTEDVWINTKDPRTAERFNSNRKIISLSENAERMLLDDSVLEDVMRGPMQEGVKKSEARSRAEAVLRTLGVSESIWNRSPFEISEGEKRMVEIAEALVVKPDSIIIQQPFRTLDGETAQRVYDFLLAMQDAGTEILMTDAPLRPETLAKHQPNFLKMHAGVKLWLLLLYVIMTLISGNFVSVLVSTLVLAAWILLSKIDIEKMFYGSLGVTVAVFIISIISLVGSKWQSSLDFFLKMLCIIWMTEAVFQTTRNGKLFDGLQRAFHLPADITVAAYMVFGFPQEATQLYQLIKRAESLRNMHPEFEKLGRRAYWYTSLLAARVNLTLAIMKRRKNAIRMACYTSADRRAGVVKMKMNKESVLGIVITVLFVGAQISAMIYF